MECLNVLWVTVIGDLSVSFGKLYCSCCSVVCPCPVRTTRRRTDSQSDSTALWSRYCVAMYHRDRRTGMYGFLMLSSRLTARSPPVPSIPRSLLCLGMNHSYLCSLPLVKLDLVWCSLCLIVFWPWRASFHLWRTTLSKLVRLRLYKLTSIDVLLISRLVTKYGLVRLTWLCHKEFHESWRRSLLVRFWLCPRSTMCRFVLNFLIVIVNYTMCFIVRNWKSMWLVRRYSRKASVQTLFLWMIL